MIVDRRHRPWAIVTLLLAVAALAGYYGAASGSLHGVTGGSTAGLWFGVVGTALMAFCGLLAAHRKVPTWSWLGSRQAWLRAHIWLGLLSVLVIACHAGFRLGGGLELWLWAVIALIVASGVFGLLLQQWLPGYLTTLPVEAPFQQLPHYCDVLRRRADGLLDALRSVIAVGDDLVDDYEARVRPGFAFDAPGGSLLHDVSRVRDEFDRWREELSKRSRAMDGSTYTESSLDLRERLRARPPHDPREQAEALFDALRAKPDPADVDAAVKRVDAAKKDKNAALEQREIDRLAKVLSLGADQKPLDEAKAYVARYKPLMTRLDKARDALLHFFDDYERPETLRADAGPALKDVKEVAALMGDAEAGARLDRVMGEVWFDALHRVAEERAGYATQARIHRWLHAWLLVHVPLSAALLVMTAFHVIMSLKY